MIDADKVSILIHTVDRSQFLLRLLDYYESVADVRRIDVVILDASREEAWAAFERGRRDYSFPLRVIRHDPALLLNLRIGRALETVATPYVIMAADDDLYFFDAVAEGVKLLDSDPSFGTVYGHTLRFGMKRFVPYGREIDYRIDPLANPPHRWLEGETAAERLADLGDSPGNLATTGWYALQRTDQLRTILDIATRHDLDLIFFEKFLILAQAALGKTRRLDRLFIARQVAPDAARGRTSFRDSPAQIARLKAASRELLAGLGHRGPDADATIDHVFRGEFGQMKRADAKRHLRRIADALPFLRTLWARIAPPAPLPFGRDERLSPPPRLEDCAAEMAIVTRIVSGPARP